MVNDNLNKHENLLSDFDIANKVVQLNLIDIVPNPFQPRKNFNEEKLNDLAASIKENGIFQPIVVRQLDNKKYEIIAGERRFRASQMIHAKTISAIIYNLTNAEVMQIAIIENLQRENLTPIEEAKAYQNLIDNLNLTQSQLAKRLGKSRPFIANYLRLLTLPKEVSDMVEDNVISTGHARTLLGLTDKSLIKQVAKQIIKNKLSVREVEKLVSDLNKPTNDKKQINKELKKNGFVDEITNQLEEKFGTKVTLKNNINSSGKIEINYLDNDDLSRILEVLNINLD